MSDIKFYDPRADKSGDASILLWLSDSRADSPAILQEILVASQYVLRRHGLQNLITAQSRMVEVEEGKACIIPSLCK